MTNIVESPWHVFGAALVFMLGALLGLRLAPVFRTTDKRCLVLYLWHTLFCLIYLWYVSVNGGDSLAYYRKSLTWAGDLEVGTSAIQLFTAIFSSFLGLSVLGVFMVFNVVGFVGLLAFDAALRLATFDQRRPVRLLAASIVFLPSISFWSSAIGKDSVAFMAVGIALWAAQGIRRHGRLMTFSIFVMLSVRPHIAALMILAVAISMLIQPGVKIGQRVALGLTSAVLAAAIIPFAMDYSGVGSGASASDLADYVDERQGYNMDGGGGLNISSLSLPAKLFTYLFRPLPFEAHNVPALAASIDNVALLFLFSVGIVQMVRGRRVRSGANSAFLWVYSLSAWLVLALTTANLGISMRQKWMFAPALIFLFLSVVGRRRMPRVLASQKESGAAANNRLRQS